MWFFWFATATGQTNRTRDALQAAHCAFHIVVHFRWRAKHTTEYVRAVGVSFLFWSQWEQTTPRKCNSGEMGEALLARRVENLWLNPNSSSLDDFLNFFLHTLAARTNLRVLHASNIENGTIKLAGRNLNTFVRQISDGQLLSPVSWKSKVKTVMVMDEWPEVPHFPISLYHDMPSDHLQDLSQRTLQTLVNPVSISRDAWIRCNSACPIGWWHNKLTISPHVTPSPINANHCAMLVGTWPCQRLSALGCACGCTRTQPCPPSPSCTQLR